MLPGSKGLPSRAASAGRNSVSSVSVVSCRSMCAANCPSQGATSRISAADSCGRAGRAEGAVGVDGVEVPAVDALVGPGAHARRHQQVHPPGKGLGVLVEEAQRAMHAAGLVAVHAARHQHAGQAGLPRAGAQRQQGETLARIGQLAIRDDFEARRQPLDHAQHVVRIAALAHLPRTPFGQLCRAPGLAGGADGVALRVWSWWVGLRLRRWRRRDVTRATKRIMRKRLWRRHAGNRTRLCPMHPRQALTPPHRPGNPS